MRPRVSGRVRADGVGEGGLEFPSGPKAPSVGAVSLLAAKLKLTVLLLRLLHVFLAGRCATPREPKTIPVFAVHIA